MLRYPRLSIAFTSLRARILLSLVLVGSLVALAGVTRVISVYGHKLERQLTTRAKSLADAVSLSASLAHSREELQRCVSVLATQSDVEAVIMAQVNPPAILASSHPHWNRHAVSELPEATAAAIRQSLSAVGEVETRGGPANGFDWIKPHSLSPANAIAPRSDTAILVRMNRATLGADLSLARFRITLLLFALVGVTAATTYWLLDRNVLKPARAIAATLVQRAAGLRGVFAHVAASDEIGQVATALNGMLVNLDRNEQERQEALDWLSDSEARARKLSEEADAARQRAEAAAQAKTEFLANMSHEIRTPMTAIVGFADMLACSIHRPEDLDAVETIKRNGEHLLHIINDILDLSKMDAQRMTVESVAVNPLEVVGDVVRLMSVRMQFKGLTCGTVIAGPVPERIWTDPMRLRQILTNLVGNAVKFTEQGKITVRVWCDERNPAAPQMIFEVSDTGLGIREDQLPLVFEPFMQGDTSTTRRFGGTGLGLAISRRFAQMLGGDIRVASQLGAGSTFALAIATGNIRQFRRLTPGEAQVSTSAGVVSGCVPPPAGLLTGRRLLLAEDGLDNQRIIVFLLKKLGAEVDVVDNGELAVAAVRREAVVRPYDGLLLDMQMAVMDGYEAASALREAGITMPIIALTAHAMNGDREKCLAAGCDDYVTKPIDRKSFFAVLAKWLPARDGVLAG